MTKKRRAYTREFKIEAVQLLERTGKSRAEIVDELGIGSSSLSRWKKKYGEAWEDAFPGHGNLTPEKEHIGPLGVRMRPCDRDGTSKKGNGHPLATKQMRFEFIDDHRDEFPVSRMCKVLDVSRSGSYVWRGRPPSKREMANRELYKKIMAVYDKSHGTYGSPRIYRELKRQGVTCSENRVARLIRLRGLRARQTKMYKITSRRNKADPVAPNVLKRDFEAERPNEKSLADITYIPTQEGWL